MKNKGIADRITGHIRKNWGFHKGLFQARLRATHARGLIGIGIFALALLATGPAQSATISLTPANIQDFVQLGESGGGSPVTNKTSDNPAGAGFTTIWSFDVDGGQSANVGIDGEMFDWSDFDFFALDIANNDEHDWTFSVTVVNATDAMATSGTQSLVGNDLFTTFMVDLAGISDQTIKSIYITVSAILPIEGHDRTAEYSIAAPIPIPASAWLFGSALGLLAWVRRRATG